MNGSHDIAIDCRLRQSTGIGRYIREVVPQVIGLMPGRRFLLLGPEAGDPWASPLLSEHVQVLPCASPIFRPAEQRLYRGVRAGVLWCPHFNVPWCRLAGTRLVVTIHDLIPLHHGVGWRGGVRRLATRWYLAAARRNACRVLTVSGVVAQELVREAGFRRDRIAVVPNGVAAAWFDPLDPILSGMTAKGPCVLYLGNLAPHKNVGALLRAFAAVVPACPHRLVVLGEERGFTGQADLSTLASALGDRVVFFRRLDESALRGLVAAAELLVLPSLEEGFGLPPLEAMAAGTPVLTSDCAALLETAAQGAHRFRLADPDDLRTQLARLLTDDALRRSKIVEGRAWARRFTWERTAELTVEALTVALEQP